MDVERLRDGATGGWRQATATMTPVFCRLPRLRWAVPMPAQQRSIRQDGPVADDLGRSAATREP
jgi:hypothetical protein